MAPNKVYFPIPLDKFIMNTLIASNTTETFVQFKMKATAPSRYAVKPRQVSHTLHPSHKEPLLHTSTRDYIPLHTTAHHYTPLHTTTHHCAPLHTATHHCTPLHTTTHHYTPLHTTLHIATNHFTPLHTISHHLHTIAHYDKPLHASHNYTPLQTTAHHDHCTPLHTIAHHSTLQQATAHCFMPN